MSARRSLPMCLAFVPRRRGLRLDEQAEDEAHRLRRDARRGRHARAWGDGGARCVGHARRGREADRQGEGLNAAQRRAAARSRQSSADRRRRRPRASRGRQRAGSLPGRRASRTCSALTCSRRPREATRRPGRKRRDGRVFRHRTNRTSRHRQSPQAVTEARLQAGRLGIVPSRLGHTVTMDAARTQGIDQAVRLEYFTESWNVLEAAWASGPASEPAPLP